MSRLSNIPDINFLSVNPETIISNMINIYQEEYEKETGIKKILKPGDSERIEILTFASMIISGYEYINNSAKQNLLKYALESKLDNLGALTNTPRNQSKAAVTKVRFTLSTTLTESVTIPGGTRVSAGDSIFFKTIQAEVIAAGTTYKDIICECTTKGSIGNKYLVGQINILVDTIPYVKSVSNTEASQGGADVESDDNYAERIYLKPNSFSVAGPALAYEYFAKEFSSSISDVKVNSSAAGSVSVVCLLENGVLPQSAFLTSLKNYLEDKRPLTDNLSIVAPTAVNYTINFTYYISSSNTDIVETIKTNVTKAVNQYISNQKNKIGKDINPDELIELVRKAGAKRLVITSPTFTTVNNSSVAIANDIPTVTFGGLEDD